MAKITNTTTDDKEQVLITKSGLEKLKIELKELKL